MAKFIAPKSILTGKGVFAELPSEIKKLGIKRPMIVVGRRWARESGWLDKLQGVIKDICESITVFDAVPPEPTCDVVDEIREKLNRNNNDSVIAMGGGSVMDVAKAGALLITSDKPTSWHLATQKLPDTALPIVAIATTSGTGSEATVAAVFTDTEKNIKQSIKSPAMMPTVALVDPELTVSCPPAQTTYAGMDALTQAIESFCSIYATNLTEALSEKAMALIGKNIITAYREGTNIEAREAMADGSLLAGLALANAKLGLVHGIAHPIGALTHKPHGLICAIALPAVLEYNRETLSAGRNKYGEMAKIFGKDPIQFVRKLQKALEIPADFRSFSIDKEQLPTIAENSMGSGSTGANPRKTTPNDVIALLENLI